MEGYQKYCNFTDNHGFNDQNCRHIKHKTDEEINGFSKTSIDRPYLKAFAVKAGSPLSTIPLTSARVNAPQFDINSAILPLNNGATGKPFKSDSKGRKEYNPKDNDPRAPAGKLEYSEFDYKDAAMQLIWTSGILHSTKQDHLQDEAKQSIEERVFRTLAMCQMTKEKYDFHKQMVSASSGLISLTHKPQASPHEALDVCLNTLNVLYCVFPEKILKSYLVDMGVEVLEPVPIACTTPTSTSTNSSAKEVIPGSLIEFPCTKSTQDIFESASSTRSIFQTSNSSKEVIDAQALQKSQNLRPEEHSIKGFQKKLSAMAGKFGQIVSCRTGSKDD